MTPSQAISKLLDQCGEDKDTMESPRGSNRGPRVEEMLGYTGLSGGYPWCAAAVAAWGIEALGSLWPVPRTADCDSLLGWARRKNCLKRTDPKPGDIFLVLKSDDDAIHTGIVVKALANGQVLTWEGNTNNDGSREGYRVCQRRRSTHNLVYVRWTEVLVTTMEGFVPHDSQERFLERSAYTVSTPHGAFPRVAVRDGRPCAPVRALVASILGVSLEATADVVGWEPSTHSVTINGVPLEGSYSVVGADGRAMGWAPVREIGEGLGYVVSVAKQPSGEMAVSIHQETSSPELSMEEAIAQMMAAKNRVGGK